MDQVRKNHLVHWVKSISRAVDQSGRQDRVALRARGPNRLSLLFAVTTGCFSLGTTCVESDDLGTWWLGERKLIIFDGFIHGEFQQIESDGVLLFRPLN